MVDRQQPLARICFASPRISAFLALLILLLLSACSDARGATGDKTLGLVSLAPSNTELIYSLSAQDRLLGVSTYCKYPREAEKKPKAGSFVSVDFERMAKLKPDIVLLVDGQEPLAIQLKKHGIKSLVLHNKKLKDIGDNLVTIGSLCGKKERGEQLAAIYAKAIDDLKAMVKNERSPKLLFCVWPRPIVTIGGESFLSDVVTTCGAANLTKDLKESYPKLSSERLISLQPEIIVLPFQSRNTSMQTTPPWSLLSSIRQKKYFFLPDPDDDYLSRPTMRVIKGLCWLSLNIHPKLDGQLKRWLAQNSTSLGI